MKVMRTADMELVRAIITHPQVYPWVIDDGSPRAEDFEPAASVGSGVIYVLVEIENARGVFAFFQQNSVTTEAHTCVLPSMWGKTHLAARAAIAWIFANTKFQRIITSVPADNPLAARLSIKAGMKLYGRNPGSFLRNGQLLDIDLYGISKEALCQLE